MSEPFKIKEKQYLVIDSWTKQNPTASGGIFNEKWWSKPT